LTLSRREFLQVVGASAVLSPTLASAAFRPDDATVVRHASIGASGMGWADLGSFATHPAFRLVAIADVDQTRTEQALAKFPGVRVYQDWRELLEREKKNLDSVNVSTPDHMHAAIAMAAMRKGLHVYVQKPLSSTIREVRKLTEYAREHRVLSQMCIQVSSMPSQRVPEAVFRSGIIGKIKEVHAFCEKGWGDEALIPEGADPVPPTLDWNGWLGVAEERPFKQGVYHPAEWRKRVGFGTGTLGDMGCHIFTPPYRALGLTAPTTVTSHGPAPNRDNWPLRARVHYVFPGTQWTAGPTLDFWWYDGDQPAPDAILSLVGDRMPKTGSVWVGTDGTLVLPHMAPSWFVLPDAKMNAAPAPELVERDHYHEFLDGVRARQATPLSAGFQFSGPLTEAVLLGTVAMRVPGETLTWNARKMRFDDHDAANRHLRRKPRRGWTVKGL
jgi:predicted dehydrogenase